MKRLVPASALMVSLALAGPGCSFFESSGPPGGVSPFISEMRISRNAVTCGRAFVITFRYQDAQDDIEFMTVTSKHESGTTFEATILWETTSEDAELVFEGNLNLEIAGRASYTTSFTCDTGRPTGTYTVSVSLEDERNHVSNTRSDTITLTSN